MATLVLLILGSTVLFTIMHRVEDGSVREAKVLPTDPAVPEPSEAPHPILTAADYQLAIDWVRGERTAEFVSWEKNPVLDRYEVSYLPVSVTFDIEASCGRADGTAYLAGKDDTSKVIIEELRFQPQEGGYSSTTSPSGGNIGVSSAAAQATVALNGTFISPLDREDPVPPARRIIYQGTSLQGVAFMAADPEARFLLACDSASKTLYQLRVEPDTSLIQIYTTTQLPHLSDAVGATPWQHSVLGRVYMLEDSLAVDSKVTLLIDGNNDGVFDSTLTMTRGDFWESNHPDDMVRNFVEVY